MKSNYITHPVRMPKQILQKSNMNARNYTLLGKKFFNIRSNILRFCQTRISMYHLEQSAYLL